MDKFLCNCGLSKYWLTLDGKIVITGSNATDAKGGKVVYTSTPIKSGYSEFMCRELAEAMAVEGLFY